MSESNTRKKLISYLVVDYCTKQKGITNVFEAEFQLL